MSVTPAATSRRCLDRFDGSGVTPRKVGLFEQQGDLFLVQEALPGVTLRQWVADHLDVVEADRWGVSLAKVEPIARGLVHLVGLVHAAGLTLRDSTPTTYWSATTSSRAWSTSNCSRPRGNQWTAHTHTDMPHPNSEPLARSEMRHERRPISTASEPPSSTSSRASTRCSPTTSPRTRSSHERIRDWLSSLSAGNAAARRFAPIITSLTHEDATQRPPLEAVRRIRGRWLGRRWGAMSQHGPTASTPSSSV